jgi:predicted DNA-binding transcriptional regulator AlpA
LKDKQAYIANVESAPLPAGLDIAQLTDRFASVLERQKRLSAPVAEANLATRTLSMTASIDASDPAEAFTSAVDGFTLAATQAAGGALIKVAQAAVEIDNGDGLQRDEIVSAAEIARRLGLSRERVRQLAADPQRFPRAVGNVRGSKVWRWGDIADWIAASGRRGAGRPPMAIAAIIAAVDADKSARDETWRRLIKRANELELEAVEYVRANQKALGVWQAATTGDWIEQMPSVRVPSAGVTQAEAEARVGHPIGRQ